ncbi:MAG: hypothetical protein ACMUJM_12190 [bacterium]
MKHYLMLILILISFVIITSAVTLARSEGSSFQEDYYKSFKNDKNYSYYEELAYYNAYLSWLYERKQTLNQDIRLYEMRYNKALEDLDNLTMEITRIEEIVKNITDKFDNKLR